MSQHHHHITDSVGNYVLDEFDCPIMHLNHDSSLSMLARLSPAPSSSSTPPVLSSDHAASSLFGSPLISSHNNVSSSYGSQPISDLYDAPLFIFHESPPLSQSSVSSHPSAPSLVPPIGSTASSYLFTSPIPSSSSSSSSSSFACDGHLDPRIIGIDSFLVANQLIDDELPFDASPHSFSMPGIPDLPLVSDDHVSPMQCSYASSSSFIPPSSTPISLSSSTSNFDSVPPHTSTAIVVPSAAITVDSVAVDSLAVVPLRLYRDHSDVSDDSPDHRDDRSDASYVPPKLIKTHPSDLTRRDRKTEQRVKQQDAKRKKIDLNNAARKRLAIAKSVSASASALASIPPSTQLSNDNILSNHQSNEHKMISDAYTNRARSKAIEGVIDVNIDIDVAIDNNAAVDISDDDVESNAVDNDINDHHNIDINDDYNSDDDTDTVNSFSSARRGELKYHHSSDMRDRAWKLQYPRPIAPEQSSKVYKQAAAVLRRFDVGCLICGTFIAPKQSPVIYTVAMLGGIAEKLRPYSGLPDVVVDQYDLSLYAHGHSSLTRMLLCTDLLCVAPIVARRRGDVPSDDSILPSYYVCKQCHSSLASTSNLPPKFSFANGLAVGQLPPHLRDLSFAERALTSIAFPRACIQVLRGGNQKKMTGHFLTVQMNVGDISKRLPLHPSASSIRIVIAGPLTTPQQMMARKSSIVNVKLVRGLIEYLKLHNSLYSDVDIDHDVLDELSGIAGLGGVPSESSLFDTAAAVHDHDNECDGDVVSDPLESAAGDDGEMTVRHVGPISDIGADPSTDESSDPYKMLGDHLCSYLDEQGQTNLGLLFSGIASGDTRGDIDLFPLIFHDLFPFNTGGFGPMSARGATAIRPVPIGLDQYLNYLMRLISGQFQSADFVLRAFNHRARQRASTAAWVKVNVQNLDISGLRRSDIISLAEYQYRCSIATKLHNPLPKLAESNLTATAKRFAKSIQLCISKMEHTNEYSRHYGVPRSISMNYAYGPPTLMVTLNPNDLSSSHLMHFAGYRLGRCSDGSLPVAHLRNEACTQRPGAQALDFQRIMDVFIRYVVGYDLARRVAVEGGGIFGTVYAVFGAVEAQNRGSLHQHLLIWVSGALTPMLHNFILRQKQQQHDGQILRAHDFLCEQHRVIGLPAPARPVRASTWKLDLQPMRDAMNAYLESIIKAELSLLSADYLCPYDADHSVSMDDVSSSSSVDVASNDPSTSSTASHFGQITGSLTPYLHQLHCNGRGSKFSDPRITTCRLHPLGRPFNPQSVCSASVMRAREMEGMVYVGLDAGRMKAEYNNFVYDSVPLHSPPHTLSSKAALNPSALAAYQRRRRRYLIDLSTIELAMLSHDSAHRPTCFKPSDPRRECRYHFPHPVNAARGPVSLMWNDSESQPVCTYSVHRSAVSSYMNKTHPTLSALFGSNSDVTLVDGPVAGVYLTMYNVKEHEEEYRQSAAIISALDKCVARAEQKSGTESSHERDMTSCVSPQSLVMCAARCGTRQSVISAPTAAFHLLMGERYPCSDRFTHLPLVSADECVMGQMNLYATIHKIDDKNGNAARDETAEPVVDVDSSIADMSDLPVDRSVPIARLNISLHDYVCRPELLDDMCWYEYTSLYSRSALRSNQANSLRFTSEHPLSATHYCQPNSLLRTPIIVGRLPDDLSFRLHPNLDIDAANIFGRRAYLLFVPWRSDILDVTNYINISLRSEAYSCWNSARMQLATIGLDRRDGDSGTGRSFPFYRILANMQFYREGFRRKVDDADDVPRDNVESTNRVIDEVGALDLNGKIRNMDDNEGIRIIRPQADGDAGEQMLSDTSVDAVMSGVGLVTLDNDEPASKGVAMTFLDDTDALNRMPVIETPSTLFLPRDVVLTSSVDQFTDAIHKLGCDDLQRANRPILVDLFASPVVPLLPVPSRYDEEPSRLVLLPFIAARSVPISALSLTAKQHITVLLPLCGRNALVGEQWSARTLVRTEKDAAHAMGLLHAVATQFNLNQKQSRCLSLIALNMFRTHFFINIHPLSVNTQRMKDDQPANLYTSDRYHQHREAHHNPYLSPSSATPLYAAFLGCAGTGKSRVIESVIHLYSILGLRDSLMVCAYTGTAAIGIGGSTIHHELGIGIGADIGANSSAPTDEHIKNFAAVSMILVDEVSMVGAEMLSTMNKRLQLLRQGNALFGGCSIAFFGDFMQFPPVLQVSLIPAAKKTRTQKIDGQAISNRHTQFVQDGKALWHDYIKRVVILDQQMRQADDPVYAEHLQYVRDGTVTQATVDYFNQRVVFSAEFAISHPQRPKLNLSFMLDGIMHLTPIVCSENADRIEMNRSMFLSLFRRWCDDHVGADPSIHPFFIVRSHLYRPRGGVHSHIGLSPSVTAAARLIFVTGRDHFLYLHLGMHVLISTNLALPLGIANGSRAVVTRLQMSRQWYTDEEKARAKSKADGIEPDSAPPRPRIYDPRDIHRIIVRLMVKGVLSDEYLAPHLGPGEFAVEATSAPLKTRGKTTAQPECMSLGSITMTQFAIQSAHTMTAHRTQGLTLDSMLLVTMKVNMPHFLYVALSRVRSLSSLYLLGPLPNVVPKSTSSRPDNKPPSCYVVGDAMKAWYVELQKRQTQTCASFNGFFLRMHSIDADTVTESYPMISESSRESAPYAQLNLLSTIGSSLPIHPRASTPSYVPTEDELNEAAHVAAKVATPVRAASNRKPTSRLISLIDESISVDDFLTFHKQPRSGARVSTDELTSINAIPAVGEEWMASQGDGHCSVSSFINSVFALKGVMDTESSFTSMYNRLIILSYRRVRPDLPDFAPSVSEWRELPVYLARSGDNQSAYEFMRDFVNSRRIRELHICLYMRHGKGSLKGPIRSTGNISASACRWYSQLIVAIRGLVVSYYNSYSIFRTELRADLSQSASSCANIDDIVAKHIASLGKSHWFGDVDLWVLCAVFNVNMIVRGYRIQPANFRTRSPAFLAHFTDDRWKNSSSNAIGEVSPLNLVMRWVVFGQSDPVSAKNPTTHVRLQGNHFLGTFNHSHSHAAALLLSANTHIMIEGQAALDHVSSFNLSAPVWVYNVADPDAVGTQQVAQDAASTSVIDAASYSQACSQSSTVYIAMSQNDFGGDDNGVDHVNAVVPATEVHLSSPGNGDCAVYSVLCSIFALPGVLSTEASFEAMYKHIEMMSSRRIPPDRYNAPPLKSWPTIPPLVRVSSVNALGRPHRAGTSNKSSYIFIKEYILLHAQASSTAEFICLYDDTPNLNRDACTWLKDLVVFIRTLIAVYYASYTDLYLEAPTSIAADHTVLGMLYHRQGRTYGGLSNAEYAVACRHYHTTKVGQLYQWLSGQDLIVLSAALNLSLIIRGFHAQLRSWWLYYPRFAALASMRDASTHPVGRLSIIIWWVRSAGFNTAAPTPVRVVNDDIAADASQGNHFVGSGLRHNNINRVSSVPLSASSISSQPVLERSQGSSASSSPPSSSPISSVLMPFDYANPTSVELCVPFAERPRATPYSNANGYCALFYTYFLARDAMVSRASFMLRWARFILSYSASVPHVVFPDVVALPLPRPRVDGVHVSSTDVYDFLIIFTAGIRDSTLDHHGYLFSPSHIGTAHANASQWCIDIVSWLRASVVDWYDTWYQSIIASTYLVPPPCTLLNEPSPRGNITLCDFAVLELILNIRITVRGAPIQPRSLLNIMDRFRILDLFGVMLRELDVVLWSVSHAAKAPMTAPAIYGGDHYLATFRTVDVPIVVQRPIANAGSVSQFFKSIAAPPIHSSCAPPIHLAPAVTRGDRDSHRRLPPRPPPPPPPPPPMIPAPPLPSPPHAPVIPARPAYNAFAHVRPLPYIPASYTPLTHHRPLAESELRQLSHQRRHGIASMSNNPMRYIYEQEVKREKEIAVWRAARDSKLKAEAKVIQAKVVHKGQSTMSSHFVKSSRISHDNAVDHDRRIVAEQAAAVVRKRSRSARSDVSIMSSWLARPSSSSSASSSSSSSSSSSVVIGSDLDIIFEEGEEEEEDDEDEDEEDERDNERRRRRCRFIDDEAAVDDDEEESRYEDE